MIEVNRSGRIPRHQFDRLDRCWDRASQRVEQRLARLATGLDVGKAYFDPDAGGVWTRLGMTVAGVGPVSGVSALVPTEYGAVQMTGWALAHEAAPLAASVHEKGALQGLPGIGWVDWGGAAWAGLAGAVGAGLLQAFRKRSA